MRSSIIIASCLGCLAWSGAAAAQDAAPPASTTTTTSDTTTTSTPAPVVAPPADPTPSNAAATSPTLPPAAMESTTTSPINRPLLVTGLITFGGTYGASAIDADASSRVSDRNYLYYPVVGPWMDLAHRCDAPQTCGGDSGNKALLILDGVGQGLGALAVVTSFFIPEKTTHSWFLIGDSGVRVAPANVGTGYGVGAVGSF